uniref:WAP four-disulfide core domain 2 n=1 Tax=Pavo cristatus TaxID=9049 RepID=A0A8C9EMV1_PAVCR
MARRGSLAQPVPYEPPGRQSPPAPPGEELKAQPGGPARAQLPCTMPKASSALLLAGPPTHTVCLCLSVKAGVCPEPAAEEANCTMGCQSDGDCESTLKCCPAACGKACQEPNEKPGTCPSVKPGIPMLGLCINQCKMDSNCSGSLKCCRNGCGKVSCVTPLH